MSKKRREKNYGEVIWTGKKCYFGLPISFTRYILTDTKLYTKMGLLNIREERIELYRVIDFSLRLPLGQRIFGCGTIIVHAKDKTCPELMVKSIKKARPVLRSIEEYVEKERVKYNIHGRDMIAASGMSVIAGMDGEM
ncbi:MAG: PH domain-containing protein [Oscillospiraceae bacterium]|nr:PH domain-containing protein [Oscillospiraceae bacterium]